MIILNEKKYIEDMIDNGQVNINKPSETIGLLIKYYRQQEKNKKQCYNLVNTYMIKNYNKYNEVKWYDVIQSTIKNIYNKKYDLKEVESVNLTQAEIDNINKPKGIRYKKLMFVMTIVAKFNNICNDKNNNWVNLEDKEIFKLANIKNRSNKQQCEMLNKLMKKNFIEFSRKIDNTNNRVVFIDNNKENIIYNVTDIRDLGILYDGLMRELKIKFCKKCGKVIKNSSNGKSIYCEECAKEIDREKAKIRMSNKRKL